MHVYCIGYCFSFKIAGQLLFMNLFAVFCNLLLTVSQAAQRTDTISCL